MKKAIINVIAVALAAASFAGCASKETTTEAETEATSTAEVTTTTTTEATTTTTTEETTTETTISRTVNVSIDELDELLAKQPLYVSSTEYVVQDSRYKSLYPDLLQAVITNNSEDDIKNAVIEFVAWDENNLPVMIKGHIDFSNGSYLIKCNYNSINLVPGESYGEDSGMAIDESVSISTFKAIVCEYENFDGKTWKNPYLTAWENMYGGGKKLKDDLRTDVYLTTEDYEEMIRNMNETETTDDDSDQITDQEP